MRSIFVRVEPTVRLVTGATAVELLIALRWTFEVMLMIVEKTAVFILPSNQQQEWLRQK